METILNLAQLILLLSAAALCVALIIYVGRITKRIEEIQTDVHKISEQVSPLVDSLQLIGNSFVKLSNRLNKQVEDVEWIVSEVKEKIENLKTFGAALRFGIDDRMKSLISSLGFVKGKIQSLFKKS